MFYFDASEHEDDLWSTSSPQPEDAPFQVYHTATSPATATAATFQSLTVAPASSPATRDDPRICTEFSPPASPTSPSSAQAHQTSAHEWQAAAQENAEGIHYTREPFPSESISYLAATFAREPVQVRANERVVVLDEMSEFALRVKVVRTGQIGVLPAWNVEGALERLARLNMIFNEVATCPKEINPAVRHAAQSANANDAAALALLASTMHVHDRCISESRFRLAFDGHYSPSPSPPSPSSPSSPSPSSSCTASDCDEEEPATPLTPPAKHVPQNCHHHESQKPPKRRKSVDFVMSPMRTVFRYVPVPEMVVESLWSDGESESEEAETEQEGDTAGSGEMEKREKGYRASGEVRVRKRDAVDQRWWWDGWEESEELPVGPPAGGSELDPPTSIRAGRARVRRGLRAYIV